ncbi:MAG: hypothetical protein MK074_07915 [Phycisphaerales bacterium]|nr:hypothetical protein [Phycisphaerales bacterium]
MSQAQDKPDPKEHRTSTSSMLLLLPSDGPGRRDWVRVEHDTRPARLHTNGGREVYPDWDRAHDDAGVLRRCILCGEEHMFRRKRLPRLTGIVVVLAFTLALLSLLGYVGGPIVLGCMIAVLILDLCIWFFSPESLACYGCHAEYRDLMIGHWHTPWNRTMARRFNDTSRPGTRATGDTTTPH